VEPTSLLGSIFNKSVKSILLRLTVVSGVGLGIVKSAPQANPALISNS